MTIKNEQDPVENQKERNDHAFNDGHWINKLTRFSYLKPNKWSWALTLFYVLIFGTAFGIVLWLYILAPDPPIIILLIVLFLALLFETIQLWRFSRVIFSSANNQSNKE